MAPCAPIINQIIGPKKTGVSGFTNPGKFTFSLPSGNPLYKRGLPVGNYRGFAILVKSIPLISFMLVPSGLVTVLSDEILQLSVQVKASVSGVLFLFYTPWSGGGNQALDILILMSQGFAPGNFPIDINLQLSNNPVIQSWI
jgi:hypothetical protein